MDGYHLLFWKRLDMYKITYISPAGVALTSANWFAHFCHLIKWLIYDLFVLFSLLLARTRGRYSNRSTKFLFTCGNIFCNPCLIASIMTRYFSFPFFFYVIILWLKLQWNSLGRRVNLKLIFCCLPTLYTQLDFQSNKRPWQKGNRYRDLKLVRAKKELEASKRLLNVYCSQKWDWKCLMLSYEYVFYCFHTLLSVELRNCLYTKKYIYFQTA